MRRRRPQDRTPFAKINADPEVMRYFPAALTRQQSDALNDRTEAYFGLAGAGRLIGFTGLSRAAWEAVFTPAIEVPPAAG